MHWFYCTDIRQQTALLDEVESRHCIKSLRHSIGDEVILCDGKGNVYNAEISNSNARSCELLIKDVLTHPQPSYKLHIAIAPTKQNERFEWFLEKATEIGIAEITPILCSNSERRKINIDRYKKVLITALKQSHQSYLPTLNELTSVENFSMQNTNTAFIAHCRDGNLPLLQNCIKPTQDSIVLIGPEGDFTREEIRSAINAGYKPISLGRSRLRTETAGIVASQTLAFVNS